MAAEILTEMAVVTIKMAMQIATTKTAIIPTEIKIRKITMAHTAMQIRKAKNQMRIMLSQKKQIIVKISQK